VNDEEMDIPAKEAWSVLSKSDPLTTSNPIRAN
jgi:hypothetical protein